MQTITRTVLGVGLLACVLVSAVQAMAHKPQPGGCTTVNGACVSLGCRECGPAFPSLCTCLD